VTGAYQDLLTLDDVLENDLILFVSLNSNRNQRAVEALGRFSSKHSTDGRQAIFADNRIAIQG